MATARDRVAWIHTSSVLAMLVNANPFRGGKAAKPEDFNPHTVKRRKGPSMTGQELGRLMVALHKRENR